MSSGVTAPLTIKYPFGFSPVCCIFKETSEEGAGNALYCMLLVIDKMIVLVYPMTTPGFCVNISRKENDVS